MKTHHVKILPKFFQEILDGKKPFEARINDRKYKVGDRVRLNEFLGSKLELECKCINVCFEDDVDNCPIQRLRCGEHEICSYSGRYIDVEIEKIWDLGFIHEGLIIFTFKVIEKHLNVEGYNDVIEYDE